MGLISLAGVTFTRRVTASCALGSLALGRKFLLLEAWSGHGCPRDGWVFLGAGLWAPLSACSFTGCTERSQGDTGGTRCWSRKNMGFPQQPTVQLTLYAMGISVLDS